MSRINRNNYESFLIDLVEGNLDAQTAREMMDFLDVNPDIREEFEAFDNIFLEPGSISFENKKQLKQKEIISFEDINEDNYESLFVAYHENDLSVKAQKRVETFVRLNPSLKKDFELFGKLSLTADSRLTFDKKEELYRQRKIIPLYWITSAAAVLLVLFTVWGVLKYSGNVPDSNTNQNMTQNNSPVANHAITDTSVKKDTGNKETSVATNIVTKKPAPHKKEILPVKAAPVTKTTVKKQYAYETLPLNEMPVAGIAAKLTDDEIYCRIKSHGHIPGSGSSLEKRKSLAGKLIAGLFNKARKKIDPIVPEKNSEPLLAKVFDGGARVLNNYTGTEANVTKYYDNRGNLIAYHFSGGKIDFSKQFKTGD